jgi:hypothetical protein
MGAKLKPTADEPAVAKAMAGELQINADDDRIGVWAGRDGGVSAYRRPVGIGWS